VDKPSFTWPNWFEHVGNEHRAVRERVALIDQSSFAKMEVLGPGALAALQHLSVADLDRPVGSVVYTQMCNERGGIEADVTVTRVDAQHFYVVTGTAFGDHDFGWVKRHLPRDGSVHGIDVTSAYAVLNLCGPLAREVLSKLAEEPVDNASFGFARMKNLTVGAAPARVQRVSFTGELGFELHVPTEYAAHVYEQLCLAGERFGMADVGYRALNTLRMEKGFAVWAGDLTPDYTPHHARLERFIDYEKGDFIGRDALRETAVRGPGHLLCLFSLAEKVPVFGGEAILRNDKVLGVTTSGDFAHTIDKPIVMGYVPSIEAGFEDYAIEVFGDAVAARCYGEAPYDPTGKRMRS